MSDRARFTISMTIRDSYTGERYEHCIDCDEALRISIPEVGNLKSGFLRATSVDPMAEMVMLMRTREMRRTILFDAARRLAGQMADRMQDAEGWHDVERIEKARKALGGDWRD